MLSGETFNAPFVLNHRSLAQSRFAFFLELLPRDPIVPSSSCLSLFVPCELLEKKDSYVSDLL